MHSTGYRHIRTLLESEKLTAIQLTLDHEAGGPPFEVLMDQASQILAKKPLLVGLSGSLTFILFATALNWLIVPGFNVSHLKPFLKVIPEDRRPEYYSTFSAAMNFGSFFCPLIGVFLAGQIGFSPMLVACGVMSVVGAASFYLWPVQLRYPEDPRI